MTSPVSLAARWVIVIGVVSATMFGFVPLAEAHTDFESSTPADGAFIDEPVSEVQLRFTAASIVAGDGFVVLTPSGEILQPETRISEDGKEFTLAFSPALADGVVGVQWSVRAGDAHPIEGTFSFTTTASAPVADPAQPESVDAPSAASTNSTSAQEAGSIVEGAVEPNSDSSNGADIAADTAASSAEASSDVEQADASPQAAASAAALSMDEFLNTDTSSSAAGPLNYLGRFASQAGSLIAIGVIGFALMVSRPQKHEPKLFVYLVRQAAALVLLGTILRAVGLVVELGGLRDGLINSTGLAVGLRAAGATALLLGTGWASNSAAGGRQSAASVSERAAVAVGGGSFSGAIGLLEREPSGPPTVTRQLQPSNAIGPLAFWPAAVIALSFVFDGHTVTKGNHLLTGLVAVVHVVGGGVWLGGLICLVLLSRKRSSQGSDFVNTVVRFSVVAAVALAAVGAAGLVLTVTILDSVSELWATAWGRILIAKVLIVAVAVAAGAFNHYVLVPEMQSISAHNDARRSFVQTLVIELIALGLAVAVTAFLVAAAS